MKLIFMVYQRVITKRKKNTVTVKKVKRRITYMKSIIKKQERFIK